MLHKPGGLFLLPGYFIHGNGKTPKRAVHCFNSQKGKTLRKILNKYRKSIILSLCIFLILIIFILTAAHHCKSQTHIYAEDYPAIYQEQLHIMFGPDYQISEKETVIIEAVNCDCGFHTDGYQYDVWEITYQDQAGYTYTQKLNNMDRLEKLQIGWLEKQLGNYYKQKYMIEPFSENTFQDLSSKNWYGKSYCFIFFGNPVISYTMDQKEEYDKTEAAEIAYKNQLLQSLQDENHMIQFYRLNYKTIFQRFPLKVSMHFSIDDTTLMKEIQEDKTSITIKETKLIQDILSVMKAFNEASNDTCNLEVYINLDNGSKYLYDDTKSRNYKILCGEWFQEDSEDPYGGYDWQLFYACEGVFW